MSYKYKLIIVVALLLSISCNFHRAESSLEPDTQEIARNNQPSNTWIGMSANEFSKVEQPVLVDKSIRSIDFRNFAYPVCPNSNREMVLQTKNISLSDGTLEINKGQFGSEEDLEYKLTNVSYYDLTGDGGEDAIVTLGIHYFQGTVNCTFIFTLRREVPKLLWTHEFGYGPDGGIRKLSVEDNSLLVEQYVRVDAEGVCCPEAYTRSSYKWNGKQFLRIKSEVLPVEVKQNLFLGYPNDS